jgi:hypothetical protein
MIYIIDTCVFRHIFGHVYRTVIPEVWDSLEQMLTSGEVVSVKEAYKELELQFSKDGKIISWLKKYKSAFSNPTNEEAMIVSQIYMNRNFQNGIQEKNILQGMPVADPFLIAKAKVLGATVVTREKIKPNAAKVPNICEQFEVAYIGEEEFQLILRKRQMKNAQ